MESEKTGRYYEPFTPSFTVSKARLCMAVIFAVFSAGALLLNDFFEAESIRAINGD